MNTSSISSSLSSISSSLSSSYAITQSTAIAMMQYYTREATHAPYVSLKKCGIINMKVLLSALSQLPHMLSLDLSDNEIVSLPSGMDLAKCMPQLRALDLSNNPLEISELLINALQQLRELHALCISLPSNSKRVVQWIVQSLPQLRLFNGVKINRSHLLKDNDNDDNNDESETLPGIKMKENVFSKGVQSDLQQYHNGISTTVDNNNNNNNNNNTRWSVNPSVRSEKDINMISTRDDVSFSDKENEDYRNRKVSTKELKGFLNTLKLKDYSLNFYKDDKKISRTREVSFLQQSEHPQLSLLSVLRIIQKMAWRKQRREEERRQQNLLNTQTKQEQQYQYPYYCYYETMIQYMFVFFVEQYSDASETEIVGHIMEFMRSLHYYSEVEKCVEAYVFLQVLNNKIEESYWFLFESLCTSISELIEHIVCSNVSDRNTSMIQSGIDKIHERENLWIRHCTHHGFLCKEHVFRIVDALIPISQRDSLLHIDIVETVITLLSVSESDKNKNNNNKIGEFQSTTITTGCLLRCLCEVFVKHHERSIQPIVEAFYTVSDVDSIGIINLAQLRDLLQSIESPIAATAQFFTRIYTSITAGPLVDAPITFSAVVEATRHFVRESSFNL